MTLFMKLTVCPLFVKIYYELVRGVENRIREGRKINFEYLFMCLYYFCWPVWR